jgi:mono/diheme cytochrome c family protein
MRKLGLAGVLFGFLGLCVSAGTPAQTPSGADAQTAVVKQYCASCHNDRTKSGGLSLSAFDVGTAPEHAVVAEKMIRKLRASMMPPPGARRPEPATLTALAEALESRVDAAAARTDATARPFQRLNRAEYGRAVRDLLAIDVDVSAFLPPDTISQGFDNVADAQAFSPALMEGYLRAASQVTALAVGDPDAGVAEAHYRVPKTASQMRRVDGAPLGTRGGISVRHTFPADGEYVFRMDLHGNADGFLYGGPAAGEQIELSIDGVRKALLNIDPRMAEVTTGLVLKTPTIQVPAGAHRVTAAFIQRFEGPVNDLIAPVDQTLADTQIGVAYGITTLPHLKDLSIVGPQQVTGVSETASRRRIFSCRPTGPGEESACAAQIVKRLGGQAFRRPLGDGDFKGLMRFYEEGRTERNFEYGVASAIEAILASPQFVFRLEPAASHERSAPRRPAEASRSGDTAAKVRDADAREREASAERSSDRPQRIGDVDLASRLSFFLWATAPDEDLLAAATRGRLGTRTATGEQPALAKQVKRMLADPKAEALSTRFAAQWLRLSDVEGMLPDAVLYPYYDHTLGEAFVRETELFFDSIVREDRSVLDLLTADYSFVNERVARHYGIPNVTGNEFRRVTLPENRRGLLGQGSVLVLTSVADRTSPVMRGKWVMEVLLGSPPPPPPPNVPALEATSAQSGGKILTVRERMEEHRKNPACASCHRVIDPLGLALENFDPTGKWRIKDNGFPVDAAGVMYDGTKLDGPAGLRNAVLKRQAVFLESFTESLMTYALGRRIEYTDMPTVRRIVRDAEQNGYKFSSFIGGIVNSPAFQMRAERPADTNNSSAGLSGPRPGGAESPALRPVR